MEAAHCLKFMRFICSIFGQSRAHLSPLMPGIQNPVATFPVFRSAGKNYACSSHKTARPARPPNCKIKGNTLCNAFPSFIPPSHSSPWPLRLLQPWPSIARSALPHVYSKTGSLEAYGTQTQAGLLIGLEYS